jgi:hypothetical protein
MKIAIYEPEPRLCGPGTWAQHMRYGFRAAGHECDVVTFTKSGKPAAKWGRPIAPEQTLGQQCPLSVDVVNPELDAYDGIVLTDVRCAPQEKAAWEHCELPEYIYRLSATTTRWTSAIHGRWYWAEHECPDDKRPEQGSPFIEDLLGLQNFAGALLCHANGQDDYCEALRKTHKVGPMPLPYVLKHTGREGRVVVARSIATIGRVIPTKYRHLISQAVIEGHLKHLNIVYAGSNSGAQGPVESFLLWEQLEKGGFTGTRDSPGVKKPSRWRCDGGEGVHVEFRGAYDDPWDVLHDCNAHVGIADCDFSHGLLEFATLEAIDCGLAPVVSEAYLPHAKSCENVIAWPHRVKSIGKAKVRGQTQMFADLRDCVERALALPQEARDANREMIKALHDPKLHAEALCSILG